MPPRHGRPRHCAEALTYRRLAIGRHRLLVRSGADRAARFRWRVVPVDGAAHAVRRLSLKLTQAPPDPTTATDATFSWQTSDAVSATNCVLDGVSAPCSSPKSYTGLATGSHTFKVTVYSGRSSASSSWSWSVSTPAAVESSPTPTPTPTPTSTPPSEPSKWKLVLADDFNGTDLDPLLRRKYGETSDWPGHAGHGLRVGRAISVENGAAVITAKEVDNVIESGAFTPRSVYTTHGRYKARVRTLPDPSAVMIGLVLTWPTSNNQPLEGELDFYEAGRQRTNFKSFVHYGASDSQVFCTHLEDPTQWHDVAMEWEPDRLEIFVDGASRCKWTDPRSSPTGSTG